ncbi:MAG: RagB/SusD family nutrient uptake outer membrane protein [Bacteroidia bacterium]|nr:RagB/SusD family nutrient uptake outer membrane protein [Bacteroidia bacterium]
MKKNHILLIVIIAVLGIVGACKEDFLNITPNGALDASVMGTETGVNGLLIGAYAVLDGLGNDYSWNSASENWVYGDIRGMIANKGTDAGDQPDINPMQSFTETSTNPYLNTKWREVYEAVSRCNNVILVANKAVADGKLTQDKADNLIMQARALRGWYHFEAWRMWEKVPYIDEKTDAKATANTADIRQKILDDMTEGTKLPNDMEQIGRFNKTVSQVILAKAMMQMNHDYAGALTLLQEVKTSGTNSVGDKLALYPNYGDLWVIENRNVSENVYTVQYSVNDGSGGYNAGYGLILNFPYKGGGSPGGCCGFFQPTQEFVNSFRTVGGLPLLDGTYNLDPVKSDQGLNFADPFVEDAGELDPRLDWAVGRRGIPYFDWGIVTGSDWVRDQTYAGPYSNKKQVYKKSQERVLTDITNWTNGLTANGYRMIRFADVLLLLAECQIETNDLTNARINVNLVRARAAIPAGWVKEADGVTNAANYVINEYPTSGYPFDTQANARKALYMERKLELGMEGHRYFDLNRWGITVAELNRVLAYETTTPWGKNGSMYLQGAAVVGPEDVTFPIPQRQLDLMPGVLVQNR